MSQVFCRISLFTLILVGCLWPCMGMANDGDQPIQVFILAGQSNMEGQGVVDLDHPQHYNGGRGTLQQIVRDSNNSKSLLFQHI